jgi:hypothetical protein
MEMDSDFIVVSSKKNKIHHKTIEQANELQKEIHTETKILTQEEMMDELISKVKTIPTIEIKTKEIEKEKGMFYSINLRVDLSHIGFGVFHSAKLNTVSHINRIVNMKLIFSDNTNLHEDMKINRDALIQCFREIIPNTITSIKIDTFKDQLDNEHLCLTLTTIKINNLTYIYEKMIDYVNVINKKYGEIQKSKHTYKTYTTQQNYENNNDNDDNDDNDNDDDNDDNNTKSNDTLKEDIHETKTHSIEDTETINNKLIINNSIKTIIEELTKEEKRLLLYLENVKQAKLIILDNKSIKHIVEELNKEEKRLVLEIENSKKLLKAQLYVLENTLFDTAKPATEKPVIKKPVIEKPATEKPVIEKSVIEKPVIEKPVSEKPVIEKPVIEKPVSEKPVIEKPVIEKNNKLSFAQKVANGNTK